MSSTTIIAALVALTLAFAALKFLLGLIRTVISAAFFLIAAGLILSLISGQDFISSPTAAALADTVNQTIQNVTMPV